MKKNQLKLGSLLSYLQMGLNVIIQLVYTPVMIRLLGQSEYGLYNTVASTVSMLSILNLGFNSGYVRYYAIYKKDGNKQAIYRLNGLFLIIFTIIGIVALGCGLFLTSNLNLVFDEGLTAEEYETAKVLMLILTFNLALSFPLGVFQNIILAQERFIFQKLIMSISTVLSPLVTLPLLLMGYRSIAMVAVTVSVQMLVYIIFVFYVFFKLKEKFFFTDFEKGVFKGLFAYTIFIALNTIIDQINWNVDKLLLGRYKGTNEVAIYSVGYTLYHAYQLFSQSVSNVFTPRIHKIVNDTNDDEKEQKKQLTEIFTRVGRIQFLILGLIVSGVVFFGKYFITEIWTGKSYGSSYYVALLLMIPASIALIQNLGIEIQRAENKHQFRSIVYLFMAFINLGLSVVLCQKYGSVGSAVGTAVSLVFANGLIMNIYYHKKCNIDIIFFWKNILRQAVGLLVPVAVGAAIMIFIDINSLVMFAALVLVYVAVYAVSVWFISMNDYERNLIAEPVKKILGKFSRNN